MIAKIRHLYVALPGRLLQLRLGAAQRGLQLLQLLLFFLQCTRALLLLNITEIKEKKGGMGMANS